MIPLYFGPTDRALYGVYDRGAEPRRRQGVVVLNPWGWEAIRAHRTLRTLASQLAAEGIDAFRFDYSGSGDSHGTLGDATLEQWLQDCEEAMEELMATGALGRVSLVGLRFGGLLATEVAMRRRSLVERVVLWEAPETGGEFLSSLRAEGSGETGAFAMPGGLRQGIAGLDGRRLEGSPVEVAVASRESDPVSLQARGVVPIPIPTDQPKCWVENREDGAGLVPMPTIHEIVRWLLDD